MAVLSVDLAYRRWSDVGIVVLERAKAPLAPFDYGPGARPIACQIIPSGAAGQRAMGRLMRTCWRGA